MRTHKILSILILLIGVVLVIMPFAYQMFDRAAAGADMMQAFEPILTRENVDTFRATCRPSAACRPTWRRCCPPSPRA